jgi:beta-lactam-binding protein with PASTA domain
MPDVTGLTAREAVRTLMQVGLTPRLDGDGFVIDQSPRAGAALTRSDTCLLTLGRRQPAAAGGTGQ